MTKHLFTVLCVLSTLSPLLAQAPPSVDGELSRRFGASSGPGVRTEEGIVVVEAGDGARVELGDRAHVVRGDVFLDIALRDLGRDGSSFAELRMLAPVSPTARGASARRGVGIEEWWRGSARGLEHGMTIARRPAGRGHLRATIDFGDARVTEVGADSLSLAIGPFTVRYGHLVVFDARGDDVSAWFEQTARGVSIVVDDRAARYPLTIDPLVVFEEGNLAPLPAQSGDRFGALLDVSSDGSRAVIAAFLRDVGATTDHGEVFVFARSSGAWTLEQRLTPPVLVGGARFGRSVAIDAAGTRVVVGADLHDGGRGGAWVYRRDGTTWVEESRLAPSRSTAGDTFGYAVGIDADGDVVAVGVPLLEVGPVVNAGGAFVFARSGVTWTQDGAGPLTAVVPGSVDVFGDGLDVSASGDRVLISASGFDDGGLTDCGAAYVFRRDVGGWGEEARLLSSGRASGQRAGGFVSLSGDGATALVSVQRETVAGLLNAGTVRVFDRAGTAWAETETLISSVVQTNASFGGWVSISSDGRRALVTADGEDDLVGANTGAVYAYDRVGTWSLSVRHARGGRTPGESFGNGAALSGDGSIAVVGSSVVGLATGLRFADDSPDAGVPLDASTQPDAWSADAWSADAWSPDAHESEPDASGTVDAAVPVDASVDLDAFSPPDASTSFDAATREDAPSLGDAASMLDAFVVEAGPALDAMLEGDAGVDAPRADAGGLDADADASESSADAGALGPERVTLSCTCRASAPTRGVPSLLIALSMFLLGSRWRRARHAGALPLLLWIAVLCTSSLSTSRAHAQEEATPPLVEQEARALFELARLHYEAGRFEESARELERAFELSGRAELLYNAYAAYREAGLGSEAARALRRFLESAPSLETERRSHLERRLAALEAPGVSVTTEEPEQQASIGPSDDDPGRDETPALPPAILSPDPANRSSPLVLPGAIAATVGGLALLAAAVEGFVALVLASDHASACSLGPDQRHCPLGYDQDAVVRTFELHRSLAWGLFGAGLAVTATGALLLGLGLDEESRISLACGPFECGARLSVRF